MQVAIMVIIIPLSICITTYSCYDLCSNSIMLLSLRKVYVYFPSHLNVKPFSKLKRYYVTFTVDIYIQKYALLGKPNSLMFNYFGRPLCICHFNHQCSLREKRI